MKLAQALQERSDLQTRMRQLEERRERMAPERERESGRLECGAAYPGTKVRIGDEVLRLRHVERRCVITMFHGEIVVM